MNEIEIIVIGEGRNYHKKILTEQLKLKIDDPGYEINIDPDRLYVVKKNLLKRLALRLFKKIHRQYQYFVTDHVEIEKEEDGKTVKVSQPGKIISSHSPHSNPMHPAEFIYIAEHSKLARKALYSLFGRQINPRHLAFIGIAAIVAIAMYMLFTGQIMI